MNLIKYVGNKSRLVPIIEKYIPKDTDVLFEPFCGSASLSLSQDIPFYLSDAQPELINFLQCVKDNPNGVIDRIKELDLKIKTEDQFMALRAKDRDKGFLNSCKLSRAARYYFIIYRGYNGLYRVNMREQGQCNTPYGGTKQKLLEDYPATILAGSEKLLSDCRGINLTEFDNTEILASVIDSGSKPFVFVDPPYYNTFDQYVKDRPDEKFWKRLGVFLEDLDKAGISFLMTNSYCDFIVENSMFSKYNIDKVNINYMVGSKGKDRGQKFEAFISNKGVQNV